MDLNSIESFKLPASNIILVLYLDYKDIYIEKHCQGLITTIEFYNYYYITNTESNSN